MRKHVHHYIENCLTCLTANSSPNRFEHETQLVPLPKAPLEIIHADHFGPLQETINGYKHVLVVVDAFSRFTWLFPVKSTSTKGTISNLETLMITFGKPNELVTDRGTAFTSKEFADFIETRGIKHRKVAVAAPWANGTVERINRFLKTSLTKLIDNQAEWKKHLGNAQYIINNTYHSVTKASPAKLMFGFEQRNHTDFPLAQFTKELTNVDIDLEKERKISRNTAVQATNLIRDYNKIYKDKHSEKPTVYKQGDYVLIRDTRSKVGESSKLKPGYKGPYLIAKSLGHNRYVIQDIPGFNLTQKPLDTIVSSDKIKPWLKLKPLINP